MNYGIYFAYWEKEWNADQKKYIEKVKKLGKKKVCLISLSIQVVCLCLSDISGLLWL